jgi:IS30 family transposase
MIDAFRQGEVLDMHADGKSIGSISRKLHISHKTIVKIIRRGGFVRKAHKQKPDSVAANVSDDEIEAAIAELFAATQQRIADSQPTAWLEKVNRKIRETT